MEEVVVDTRDVSFRFYGEKCSFMIESLFIRWNFHRYMASLSIISGEAARFDAGIY